MKSKQLILFLLSLSLFISCKNEPKAVTEDTSTTSKEAVTETKTAGQGQSSVAAVEGKQANVLQVAMTYSLIIN